MFCQWLEENQFQSFDFSSPLFPAGSDRAFWEKHTDLRYIHKAEKLIHFDWPAIKATDYLAFFENGDRKKQEIPHFARRTALVTFAMAELFEYQGRFLPDILNGLFAICEESFWGISAHLKGTDPALRLPLAEGNYIDLFAAQTASILALTCDLLKDPLNAYCPDIIPRVHQEIERRIRKPYLAHTDWHWMGYQKRVNNWNPWILSNLLITNLLTEPDRALLEKSLAKMFCEIEFFFESSPADGGCNEGANYWAVAGGSLFEFTEMLYRATQGKINFFGNEKLRKIGAFPHRIYIGNGRFANFADALGKYTPSLCGLLYLFGARIEDPRLMALSKEVSAPAEEFSVGFHLQRELFRCIYAKEIADQPALSCEDCFLPDLQVAALQRGDWRLTAKGGHNYEHHNHNDVGNFILSHQGNPLLIDIGVGTYTKKTFGPERYTIPTMQSAFHNLPLINGQMQSNGEEFAADQFSLKDNTITIGFGNAYPPKAKVQKAVRKIAMNTEGVCITDTFDLMGDGTVCEHFITPLSIRIEGDTAILGEQFALTVCGAQPSFDRFDFEGDQKLIDHWGQGGLHRLKFESNATELYIIIKEIKK